MPEGPEVRIIANQLNNLLSNKILTNYQPINTSYSISLSIPARLLYVTSHGKKIIFVFNNQILLSSLGMEGKWLLSPNKYTQLILTFDGINIYYDDKRKFGKLKLVNSLEKLINKPDWMQLTLDKYNLPDGLVPISKFNPDNIFNEIAKSIRKIGDILLDQRYFNGIGNYIKSEALYLAGISPHRPANDITAGEYSRLYSAIIYVMLKSYQSNGFTLETFCDVYGNKGNYTPAVYGKDVDIYGNKITKDYIYNRVTYWVKNLQS